MNTHKIIMGLCLSLFLFPQIEAMAADYEYGWLQEAQLRTLENKRLHEKQKKEKIKAALEEKRALREKQKLSEQNEIERLATLTKERKERREAALKEAEEETEYQAILKTREEKLKALKKEIEDQERYKKQQWTRLSQYKNNTEAQETRTKYMDRTQKSGYIFVPEMKKRNADGFIETYLRKKQGEAKRAKTKQYRGFFRQAATPQE